MRAITERTAALVQRTEVTPKLAVTSQSMKAARNVGLAAPLNDTSCTRSAIGRAPEPVVVLRG